MFNVNMRFSLFVTQTMKTCPRSTIGQHRMISLVVICVERARLWKWSHSKQYGQNNRNFWIMPRKK